MRQPRAHLRHVTPLAGGLVLALATALLGALFVVARGQRWFTEKTRLSFVLPEEGSFGLRPGADIYVMGTLVGRVDAVRIENDRMVASGRIQSDFAKFVTTESSAILRKSLGVAGDTYIEVARGSGRGEAIGEKGAALRARADTAPTDAVNTLLEQVRVELIPAVKELRAGAEQFTALMGSLRDPASPTQRLLSSAADLSEKVSRGEGLLGKLATDPETAAELERLLRQAREAIVNMEPVLKDAQRATASVANIAQRVEGESDRIPELIAETRRVLGRLDVVLSDMQETTKQLPPIARNVRRETDSLPGLIAQTQETLRQIDLLVRGIQNHWLLQGSVAEDRMPGRVPASGIGPAGVGREAQGSTGTPGAGGQGGKNGEGDGG